MENVAFKNYPDVMPYLEDLPPPVVEHLGAISLQITHEDMHPKIEVVNPSGITELKADFSQVITDPEFDSNQLADEAKVAAEQGKKKLSAVMLNSSKILHKAHEALLETGSVFGAKELETDDEKQERELSERNIVYEAACQQAVREAIKAKEAGGSERATEILESLVLLRYMKGSKSRKSFREVVRAGLGEELLQAVQTADKLFIGSDYSKVSHSLYGIEPLLEMALGKIIDHEFRVRGDMTNFSAQARSGEDLRDIFAVMTSKYGWLTLEEGFEANKGSTQMNNIKERLTPGTPAGEIGSPEYYYQLLEACAEANILDELFKCRDPLDAYRIMNELGIKAVHVTSMFGQQENYGDPLELNRDAVKPMLEIKNSYHEYFEMLVNGFHLRAGRSEYNIEGYEPREILSGLHKLVELGIDSPDLVIFMTSQKDINSFLDSCSLIDSECKKLGVPTTELIGLMYKNKNTLARAFSDIQSGDKEQLPKMFSNILCREEIRKAYFDKFLSASYPLKDKITKGESSQFPRFLQRIEAIGIPSDVASEMFASWATYSAFSVYYFKDDEFNQPTERPDLATLENISLIQAEIFEAQLKALESFVDKYGINTASSIIDTFGIYNFSRHTPKELVAQDEAWKAGKKVEAVVVEARSDWNSYTRSGPVFAEEAGDGIFYFEANSGRDTARVAVQVGQHERRTGREPDVKRFIIYAHGDNELMIMGVNREAISLSSYIKAAENAMKINASEINDYVRHLGKDFMVILQSCSTGAPLATGKNIAETLSERHQVEVFASNTFVSGVTIANDGAVEFSNSNGAVAPIIYRN